MAHPSRDRVWRTSSFSNDGSDCFEVSIDRDDTGAVAMVRLRHSKHPDLATFALAPQDWTAWMTEVEHGLTNSGGVLDVTPIDTGWRVRELSSGHVLTFTTGEVIAFQQGVAAGEFTPPLVETSLDHPATNIDDHDGSTLP